MKTPCIYELNPETNEATGTVMPFCSESCRVEAIKHHEVGFTQYACGETDTDDFGYDVHCEMCGHTIEEKERR